MTIQLGLIEAHEQTIGKIFSDSYAFEIPPYQRPYAWEKEQATELLTDLLEAMDNTEVSGGVYFLGSVVLIKSPADPKSLVVDGQQRLTTLTILISVLRDLTSNEEIRINRRSFVFQKANPDSGTVDRYRLLLRPQDRSFFSKFVQVPGATNELPDPANLQGSQQRISENAIYFRQQLARMDEERRNKLVAFIIQRCYVVAVAVPTPESARRIFRVLNARGLDLTPTDILKADFLDRAGQALETDLASRWEAIEQRLGREKMVELFGHIRMIFERDKPRIALEDGFPKFVKPFKGDADVFMTDFLEPLAEASSFLSNQQLVRDRFGLDAHRAVQSLNRVDNKDWVPAALLCFWKVQDRSKVANFLIELERLTYFLFCVRAEVNVRIGRYVEVIDLIDPLPDRPVPKIGLQLSEAEQFQFLEALSGPLYTKTRVCKPVLLRLDEALSSGGATYDDVVSIEHVLPQTVEEGSEWAHLFPAEQDRKDWTHRLANLVLLTRRINTKASNWDFSRKKTHYFASDDGSSPFPLTQGVLQTSVWNSQFLKDRQIMLIQALAKLWRLDATLLARADEFKGKSLTPPKPNGIEEGTWLDDTVLALKELGGQASLSDLYKQIARLRGETKRSLPTNYQAIVRRTLEENSEDSDAHRQRHRLFRNSDKGKGLWSLA
ncbi:DUF262 domain-containing protein [Bradyrhizobium sp. NBAIM08]|uniref:DUF262 domain-containing protein n=1 Tax=Bradyrhizobium sp. NBAIM08 TaxID=2793815 RepID=UPI001CD4721D|nr:DUF262 domain-containing protein [Bradyrhizobium sp. NBAIM08]